MTKITTSKERYNQLKNFPKDMLPQIATLLLCLQEHNIGSFTKPRMCTFVNFTGETKNFLDIFAFSYIPVRFKLKAYFKFI